MQCTVCKGQYTNSVVRSSELQCIAVVEHDTLPAELQTTAIAWPQHMCHITFKQQCLENAQSSVISDQNPNELSESLHSNNYILRETLSQAQALSNRDHTTERYYRDITEGSTYRDTTEGRTESEC